MSLAQHFNAQIIMPDAILATAKAIAMKIRSVSNPLQILLFGSAAEGNFRDGSDIDLLLIYPLVSDLNVARKRIRTLGLLHPSIPVDLIFVSEELFNSKRDLGGVCFIAAHEGISL